MSMHSGTDNVGTLLPPNSTCETPSFHTQPFRWSYVGSVYQYNKPAQLHITNDSLVWENGFWHGRYRSQEVDGIARQLVRPYISTARYAEGPNYKTDNMWGFIQETSLNGCDIDGQQAAYPWEKSNNPKSKEGCFSLNNVNAGWQGGLFVHIYRQQPADTVYSVIDELKLSKKALTQSELGALMTTSRYYLPPNPSDPIELPIFTSQTMLQSLWGSRATGHQDVLVARVTWTVFTPRFLHEYKQPGVYQRNEVENGEWKSVPFQGPFDYSQYNADVDYDHDDGWKMASRNPRNPYLSVDRPPPVADEQSAYTRGVIVEVLNGTKAMPGYTIVNGKKVRTSRFANPDTFNGFLNPTDPNYLPVAQSEQLRYQVTFQYPVNPRVDPKANFGTVNPASQFLLDTPVFDDISLTFMTAPRFLWYRQITE